VSISFAFFSGVNERDSHVDGFSECFSQHVRLDKWIIPTLDYTGTVVSGNIPGDQLVSANGERRAAEDDIQRKRGLARNRPGEACRVV